VDHFLGSRALTCFCDQFAQGTTAVEKLFNKMTVSGARERIYCHPDDAKFVPRDLPAPDLLAVRMVGDRIEFSGEPIFPSAKLVVSLN